MEDRDLLNPEDFEDTEEVETTDGKEVETEEVEDKSTDDEVQENAETQEDDSKDNEQDKLAKRNAEFAKKRREKEEKERLAKEAKLKEEAKIEGKLEVLKVNPYTSEKITDDEDLKIYEIQKKLDEEGLDPVSDLPKRLAEINRQEKAKKIAEEQEQEALNQKFKKDIEEFKRNYPDVDLKTLADDEEYLKFAENKLDRWTTTEIYEAYSAKKETNSAKKKEAMTEKIADDVANKITKNPSSNPSGKLPPKTVEQMTQEEFKKYWREKYGE